MRQRKKMMLAEKAAAALAWGRRVDEVAAEMEVEPDEIRKWMREESFQENWKLRFNEYVRYLQGSSVASLEGQLSGTDEKLKASAAAALLKLGEQLGTEPRGGLKVSFTMPPPGEPEKTEM